MVEEQRVLPVPYFLSRARASVAGPGVVVLMEGLGISPQLLRFCERLAHAGYSALAPDLFHRFGGGDPGKPWYTKLRDADALDDIAAAVNELRRQGATTVGLTGFCMGGRLTYLAATSGVGVSAAAPFYGAGIGRRLGKPACPLLAFFGGKDEYVPPDEIESVRAHHPGQVVVYPDAGHGFMRDGSESYREADAADAWNRLMGFFAEHLGAPQAS
jgi:carboxymethylenebutenolidase